MGLVGSVDWFGLVSGVNLVGVSVVSVVRGSVVVGVVMEMRVVDVMVTSFTSSVEDVVAVAIF